MCFNGILFRNYKINGFTIFKQLFMLRSIFIRLKKIYKKVSTFNELIKISLVHVCETHGEELVLFGHLLLTQHLGLVDLSLFFQLLLLGLLGRQLRVPYRLVVDRLAKRINLLVEQLEQTRRKKLKVLNVRLLGRSRRLRCLGLTATQRLFEVRVYVIVSLALALWRLDPLDAQVLGILLLLAPVLALERVHAEWLLLLLGLTRVYGELTKRGLAQLHKLGIALLGFFSALGQNGVYVFVCDAGLLGGEDVVGAVTQYVQHLVLVHFLIGVDEAALLYDDIVEAQLDFGALDDALLGSVFGDEAEDAHLLLLADAMRAVHGLEIGLWVPVRVVENDDVGRVEIDAEAARARTQHVYELGGARRVELVHGLLAILVLGAAVEATVFVLFPEAVVFKDVKNFGHLTEDKYA